VNGAPPSEAVQAQLQDRLGFELPIDDLRYWLLGVPAPGTAFELTLNSQDRAERVSQSGWTIDFDGYRTVDGELLPDKLVMRRDGVRVRIAVDHWVGPP
jgi:outer membrane lipoprotein LolB